MTSTSHLLESLRTETRDLHEELHVHPLLIPLHQGDITLDHYRYILSAFHIAYQVMERSRTVEPPICDETDVLALLDSDFAQQGLPAPTVPRANYPLIDNFSALVGYLYVKEGSTLGGQVISKHLERHLGLRPAEENRFFAGAGRETGTRWRQFLAFLHENEARVNIVRAVTQAKASFATVRLACDHTLAEMNKTAGG